MRAFFERRRQRKALAARIADHVGAQRGSIVWHFDGTLSGIFSGRFSTFSTASAMEEACG